MEKIKVGIAGLGRLGKIHAANIAFKIPNAQLTAACSIVPAELEYAKTNLGVTDVYTDYREMIEQADIDAVAIVTTSSEHCWQIEAALDAGKHVFTDKPLGVDVEQCRIAEAAVERHPDKVFFIGFMRRYDPSYAYAKKKIDAGAIGTPYMVKAAGIDPESLVEGSIKFAETSGGIFIDMAVHDIDLMRWFLGSEPVQVHAMGTTFKHPGFKAVGDDETGVATYQCENGAIGIVHVGRTARLSCRDRDHRYGGLHPHQSGSGKESGGAVQRARRGTGVCRELSGPLCRGLSAGDAGVHRLHRGGKKAGCHGVRRNQVHRHRVQNHGVVEDRCDCEDLTGMEKTKTGCRSVSPAVCFLCRGAEKSH